MAFAFDTLGYAKRLKDAGIANAEAEAHAEAARDFNMAELVTKTDLLATQTVFKTDLDAARGELRSDLEVLRADMNHRFENQTLALTVRLGGLIAIGIVILAALIRLG